MLLVIDNYDSFTYNLVQYLGELGQTVEVRRNNRVTLDEIENSLRPERIVISPGPGTPDDAGITLDVIARFSGKIPLLGVCLGHQAIGQAFGGKVIRAPKLPFFRDHFVFDGTLVLETDLMGEIGLVERGGDVDQTAYAVLSDLVAVAEAR